MPGSSAGAAALPRLAELLEAYGSEAVLDALASAAKSAVDGSAEPAQRHWRRAAKALRRARKRCTKAEAYGITLQDASDVLLAGDDIAAAHPWRF